MTFSSSTRPSASKKKKAKASAPSEDAPAEKPRSPVSAALLTCASDESDYDSGLDIEQMLPPPNYTVVMEEDGYIHRRGDPDLEWPNRPETGRYSLEAELKKRRNERWAALEASFEESRDEELLAEYEKEWQKDLKIIPPPTPLVVQTKSFKEACATLGVDEVALLCENRDFKGKSRCNAVPYLVYHTKDDRFLNIRVEAEGKKWREPDRPTLYSNLRDLAIAYDERLNSNASHSK